MRIRQEFRPKYDQSEVKDILAANVDEWYVRTPVDRQPPPGVVLLGCQTGITSSGGACLAEKRPVACGP